MIALISYLLRIVVITLNGPGNIFITIWPFYYLNQLFRCPFLLFLLYNIVFGVVDSFFAYQAF